MADQKWSQKQAKVAQAIVDEKDPQTRWRMVHDLAADMNPAVAKEQKAQAKALAKVRKEGVYRKERKAGQLRFSLSIPPLTYVALCTVDTRFQNPEKGQYSTKDGSNGFVQQLMETFPEYRTFDDASSN